MTAQQPERCTCNNCADIQCGYASDVPCGNWKPRPHPPAPELCLARKAEMQELLDAEARKATLAAIKLFEEVEGRISAYEKEHEHKAARDNNGIYIPTNVVRRLIIVRKESLRQQAGERK